MVETPPTASPPPHLAEFRRRCAGLRVDVWRVDRSGNGDPAASNDVVDVVRQLPGGRKPVRVATATAKAIGFPDPAGWTIAKLPHRDEDGALAAVIETFHADLTKNADEHAALETVSRQLSQSYEEVTFLFQLMRLLNAATDPVQMMDELVHRLLEVNAFGWIAGGFVDSPKCVTGLRGGTFVAGTLPVSESALADKTAAVCRGVFGPDGVRRLSKGSDDFARSTGADAIAVAITHDGKPIGVLMAGNKTGPDPEIASPDTTFLTAVADLLGVHHENLCHLAEQQAMSVGTVRALAAAIDAKDPYTRGHSDRVGLLGADLARAIGLSDVEAERIRVCGLVHDVGKIGVAESILRKPGRLTDEEFVAVKRHPEVGYEILRDVPALVDVLPGVLHHHERWDGNGYPHKIAGENIPLIARILALADTFDAMSSNRSYRASMPREHVLQELLNNRGRQFDPALVVPFTSMDFTAFDRMLATEKREAA